MTMCCSSTSPGPAGRWRAWTSWLDRAALRKALRGLIDQSGYPESRFRITVPRAAPETAILALEPFKPVPPDVAANGARVVCIDLARQNPTAKSNSWAIQRQSAVQAFPPGIYEGVLVSAAGELLECTSSNFYAVLGGALHTAETGILHGIARRLLLKVAEQELPLELRPVRVEDIPRLEEAFLTSAGRGVVPIVEIAEQRVGTGRPGPVTLRLRERYDEWAAAHLEPI
jgi:branched-chain amino acid aminotransferase